MKLTCDQAALLAELGKGARIVHSHDGDRAWLSWNNGAPPNDPKFRDLSWRDLRALRAAGYIGDQEDGDDESRFNPAEIITPAGRTALSAEGVKP